MQYLTQYSKWVLGGMGVWAVVLSVAACATEFNQMISGESNLSFVSKQMGVPVEGSFKAFSTDMIFDPSKLKTSHVIVKIAMNSIDVGSKEANDQVVGEDWFNVKVFPTAQFVSGEIRSLGQDRYEVSGPLTIKGITHTVKAPFTFLQQGGIGVFDGAFILKRKDYGIGKGAWADPDVVAEDVQIKFHITSGVKVSAGKTAQR